MKKARAMYIPAGGKTAVWGPVDQNVLPEGYPYKTEEAILDGTFEFAMSGPNVYAHEIEDENFALTVGKSYTIIWDGVAYQCVATNGVGLFAAATILGNLSATPVSGAPDTGEPFVVICDTNGNIIMTKDTSATHTVKVCAETIHPMAPEFLPAGVGGVSFLYFTDSTDVFCSVSYEKLRSMLLENIPMNVAVYSRGASDNVNATYRPVEKITFFPSGDDRISIYVANHTGYLEYSANGLAWKGGAS